MYLLVVFVRNHPCFNESYYRKLTKNAKNKIRYTSIFLTFLKKREVGCCFHLVFILSNLVVTLLVRLWVLYLCRHRLPSALPDLPVFFYYRYRLSGLFPNLPVFCHQNRFLRFQPIWLFLRQYTSANYSIHRIIRDVIYLWFTKVLCIF